MWGGVVSLCGVLVFSVLVFSSGDLTLTWLFLELAGLCLVPAFFVGEGRSLYALFSFIVASSLSSSLLVCSIVLPSCVFLFLGGFMIKFGFFPFFSWVYGVCTESNWLVVYLFSVVVKSSFFVLSFFFNSVAGGLLVSALAVLSLLGLGGLFWVYSFSWYHCWCHMMLSSSVVLVCAAMWGTNEILLCLYLVYFVWGSVVILFLSRLDSGMRVDGVGSYYLFVFLLLSVPASLSVFYKLVVGGCIYFCSLWVFVAWCFYSVLEQLFLLKYISSVSVPKGLFGFLGCV
uniref:NADH dehydrogenase subunit 2 n=1 Tax=Azygia hwangtsiyui TaxID=2752791 RepID=A0A7D5PB82_9TREM|nr:NADH dehydrogenase subunit 2 [Azygia hwangtsiyui]QLH90212.1 NADH dehydrogenase subunit 2 [Azygia hwangtsiyui]